MLFRDRIYAQNKLLVNLYGQISHNGQVVTFVIRFIV